MNDSQSLKIAAARAALAEIKSGMCVGLGTGTTAVELVRLLGEALRDGSIGDVKAVGTSAETEKQAREAGIEIVALANVQPLDLTIDGADEIDPGLRLIKGRGGALLREKIVEQASRRFLVIADHTKLVERLGGVPLPVEVVRFAADVLVDRLAGMGIDPVPRKIGGQWWTTDEGHVIIDAGLNGRDCAEAAAAIRCMAGVVETGYFPTEATEAIIAFPDRIERRTRG